MASYVGAKFGVAVSSGTAALHLACLAAGVCPGDEGITSPITFLATANAMVYCGGSPRFADIDPLTYNMSASEIEKHMTNRTRVVIPVHFAGQSCDMRIIKETVCRAEKRFGRKIVIVEDASHALGSLYRGRRVGCCDHSDAAVFSFHPVKHITTGEGGMVVTNNAELAEKIKCLRSHGITKNWNAFTNMDLALFAQELEGGYQSSAPMPWYYEQQSLGYNYRLTDIQSALGRSQLKKLDLFIARRRDILGKYNHAFADFPYIRIPFDAPDCRSNFHLYVVEIDFDVLDLSRMELMNHLQASGIQTQVHYIPVHLQPFYQHHYATAPGDCPEAEKYYSKCLSLPFFPGMTNKETDQVIEEIKNVLENGYSLRLSQNE
jgi:UDP-4-amino-4,6-dideoxy-N-acetyl-beta-L-altrosamine transaminase